MFNYPHVIFNTPAELAAFTYVYPAGDSETFIHSVLRGPFPVYFSYKDMSFTLRRGWQDDIDNHPDLYPSSPLYAYQLLDPDLYPEAYL